MLNPVMGQVYLVTIYNKVVRAMVKENRSHAFYSDRWANVYTQDIYAADELEAREKIAERFRAEDGFVIESVTPITH
jgi:hypothetical protein